MRGDSSLQRRRSSRLPPEAPVRQSCGMTTDLTDHSRQRVPIDAQSVDAPLSRSAVFLVVAIADSDDAYATVKDVLSDVSGLVKTVGFRDLNAHLSCNVAIGADCWQRLVGTPAPRE